MAASLNPSASSYVPFLRSAGQWVEVDSSASDYSDAYQHYPCAEALHAKPELVPCPPCNYLPEGPVYLSSTGDLVAYQAAHLCYSAADCYYPLEVGVKMGFPAPWLAPTFVGPGFSYLYPSKVDIPFYPSVPISPDVFLAPETSCPPVVHRPVPPEILELPPMPQPKSQVVGSRGKSRGAIFGKRLRVNHRWIFAKAAGTKAGVIDTSGTVRRSPQKTNSQGDLSRKDTWAPMNRRYRKKTPGELKSYAKFQFTVNGQVQEDDKVDIDGDENEAAGDTRTTVMVKNLPNKLTKGMLLSYLSRHCRDENKKLAATFGEDHQEADSGQFTPSRFDFVYLPMDFETGCNLGYAFVNFTSAAAAWRLYHAYNKMSWRSLGSGKVCEITYARIQGLGALIKRFRGTVFRCDRDDFLPVYFQPYSDGVFQGSCHYVGRRAACRLRRWRRS